jgi:hypothetical protein
VHAGLAERIARTASLDDPPFQFVVGGTWYCPACASAMREEAGVLSCPSCGLHLNRFVHALVEVYVHPNVAPYKHPSLNPLLRAALYGHTEVARAIAIHSPAMCAARGANNDSPARLALAAGHVCTAVALLRTTNEGPPNPSQLLENCMSELSQSMACAGWLSDIEHVLWHVTHSNESLPDQIDPFGFGHIPDPARADLRWLSDICQGWIQDRRFVSVVDWLPIHAEWIKRLPAV